MLSFFLAVIAIATLAQVVGVVLAICIVAPIYGVVLTFRELFK